MDDHDFRRAGSPAEIRDPNCTYNTERTCCNKEHLPFFCSEKQLKPQDLYKITIFASKKKVKYLQLNFVPLNGQFGTQGRGLPATHSLIWSLVSLC